MKKLPEKILILLIACLAAFAQAQVPDSSRVRDSAALAHMSAARLHFFREQPVNALKELIQAEANFKASDNKTGQSTVKTAFGNYYEQNELWAEAEKAYREAFELSDTTDTTGYAAAIAFRIARVLLKQEKFEEAWKFNSLALTGFTEQDSTGGMATSYVQRAEISMKLGNLNQAESFILKQGLPLLRQAGNVPGRIDCFDILGHTYHRQKKYSQAKWFFIQANMLARKLGDTTAIVASLINLGRVKVDIGDHSLAARDFKEAETLANRRDMLLLLAGAKKAFAELYTKTGNRPAAAKYIKEYEQLSDSATKTGRSRETLALRAESDAKKILTYNLAIWLLFLKLALALIAFSV